MGETGLRIECEKSIQAEISSKRYKIESPANAGLFYATF
jgi:hypothetical protein